MLLSGLSSPLWAHSDAGRVSGWLAGLAHPVSGADHVLAMVAVGLWGAQLGQPALWLLPVVFPLVMAGGGFLGLIGVPLPAPEVGIAVSGVVLGLAVALARRPPLWLAVVLVGLFAIFHGHAHGTELPAGASGLTYSLGFVVTTGLLHAGGIALGLVQRWPRGERVVRGLGAAISLGGVVFLCGALA